MRTKAEWRELKAFDLLVLSWRLQCALGLGDWRSFLCSVSHCRVARQKPALASPHQQEPLKTRSRPLVGSSGLWNLSAASATQKAGSVASRKQADAHCTERAPKPKDTPRRTDTSCRQTSGVRRRKQLFLKLPSIDGRHKYKPETTLTAVSAPRYSCKFPKLRVA